MKTFGICAVGIVGELAIKIFEESKEQLKFVVLDKADFWNRNEHILRILEDYQQTEVYYYENDEQMISLCEGIDAVILAYWGKVIGEDLLEIPKWGFINLHTSYLPYGKCKHSHYWAIVENTPYGATIMKIDSGLDTGEIIYQKKIIPEWEDTGKSLYIKGILAIKELLESHKNELLSLEMTTKPQIGEGTFHYGSELDKNAFIDLEREYTARELLNIMRARSFSPHPGAYFYDGNEKYEIEISIKKTRDQINKINYEKLVDSMFGKNNG